MGVYIKFMDFELAMRQIKGSDLFEIIEIKEPHGRLVDINTAYIAHDAMEGRYYLDAPTVIDAEGVTDCPWKRGRQ